MLHSSRSACNAPLDLLALNLSYEKGYSIALLGRVKRLSKHFYGFGLTFLLNFAYLNLVSWFYSALYDSPGNNITFPFDLEAMIDHKKKVFIDFLSLWQLMQIINDSLLHFLDILQHILLCRYRYHEYVASEFSF